uniref:cilia- and flagella-associated protein 61-like n=1 Tax=Myxine glutinosa TaxID=7769 RepID=UPI00358EFF9C
MHLFISTQCFTSSCGHEDQWGEESLTHQSDEFFPTYKGASNAFCIQLFCINPKYETRSQDFLAYVCGIFPDKEFCVMTVPPMVPELPLLQSFYNVPPRRNSTFPQDLYVFHRASLLMNFQNQSSAKAFVADVLGQVVGIALLHSEK